MLIHEEYKGGQNIYPLPEVPKQIASLRIFLVPQISWAGHVSQAGFCGGAGGLDRICLSTTGISSAYPSRRANHSGILNGQWSGKADVHGYRTCSSYYCFPCLAISSVPGYASFCQRHAASPQAVCFTSMPSGKRGCFTQAGFWPVNWYKNALVAWYLSRCTI